MYMPKYPQGPTASGMGATPYPPMGYQYQPSVSRQQAFQSTFLAPQPSIPADPMFSPEMSAPGMSMYAMSQPIFQTSSPVAHHQLAPAAVPVNAVRKAPPQSVQSPQEAQEQEQAGQADKFKTELCRKFALTGFCRYGDMCQFAHGTNELRALVRHPLYKTSPCKSFEATGTCRYGARCRFIHDEAQTELAILARGVPALNLQITEPSWEEAQAAALDAVQHLVISTGLSPQLLPATTSVPVASGGQRQSSPPRGAQRIPIPDPVSLEKAPKQSTVTSPLNAMQDNGRSLGMSGRSKSEAAELSRTLSSSKTQTSSSGEVRSISSLIMMNSNGGSNGHNPVSSPTHNQQPRVVGSSGSGGAQPHRVASSVKLVIDEDVFPPANLDARRLPVANSSWVNLSEMAQTPTPGQPPSPTRAYGRSGQSESLKHSYSQPLLGVDTWSPFNDPHLNRPAGSLASLPVIPQQTSPANNNVSNPGALGSGLRSASSNALNSFPNSASSSNLGASAFSRTENQANFRKAASYANHIWFESTEGNEDGGWSSMARARSVDGRLNIFRNLSDQDLAKTAENAQVSRLPAYEEKLGEVGLALSDDEDRGTDDGRGHDTEEDDTGFSVGKF